MQSRLCPWRCLGVIAPFIGVVACTPKPAVQWSDAYFVEPAQAQPAMLVFHATTGLPTLIPASSTVTPPGGPMCAGSLAAAYDGDGVLFAAWWAPRPDSSASLLVARSAKPWDRWEQPVVADARDSSALGCNRPPPAIDYDAMTGYVHLAYFLDSPTDGRGVYGGHSMNRGAYFHGPVPIVFGDRPVHATVANDGDRVAVAYEDPNSERARVALAISVTAGHTFEHRLVASPSTMRASRPLVAIDDRRIGVAWSAEQWENGAQGSRPMVRVAVLLDSTRGTWTEESK